MDEYSSLLVSNDTNDRRLTNQLFIEKLRRPAPSHTSSAMVGAYLANPLPLSFIFVRFEPDTTAAVLQAIEGVCSRLEETERPLVIVLCTKDCVGAASDSLKGVPHEPHAYIVTPFDALEVATTLKMFIERKRGIALQRRI